MGVANGDCCTLEYKEGWEKMEVLFINGKKNGYGVDQCGKTLTVGELIAALQEYEEDIPVYLNHNGGYTYGSITENDIYEGEPEI